MSKIVHPFHYQIYKRAGADWFVKDPSAIFYNSVNEPMQLENIAAQFGVTEEQVVIEFFRINGGLPGYYLANLRDKKYYYCGLEWESVKTTLRSLGIGRADPVEM